jgi:hypothetical protein
VHENDIRDRLAARLHLIEPRMTLLATEYALPSRHGTAGRIDILARDATGALVVLELKRTEAAAERALHELAKYAELLQQERGLGAEDVRVMIAAVEWRGLHTAFSQMAREWSIDLRGYRIVLDNDGRTPVAMQRMEPLPAGVVIALSSNQLLVQPRDGDLEAVWRWAARHLDDAGARNFIGFDLGHETYPDGLYLVIGGLGHTKLRDPHALTAAARRHGVDMSDAPAGHEAEYYAMARLCQAPNRFSIEAAGPHALASILGDPAWTVRGTRRAGVYTAEDLYPQADLLTNACTGGLSDIKYTAAANVEHTHRWRRHVSRAELALGGNATWAATCRAWLEEVENTLPRADVVLHVYNPCDLVAAIVHGWPDSVQQYTPQLMGMAKATGGQVREIRGGLVWDGTRTGVAEAFEIVHGTREHWLARRLYGETWESDLYLLDLLGLRYTVFERLDGEPPGAVLCWQDGALARRTPTEHASSGSRHMLPFQAWLQERGPELAGFAASLRGG